MSDAAAEPPPPLSKREQKRQRRKEAWKAAKRRKKEEKALLKASQGPSQRPPQGPGPREAGGLSVGQRHKLTSRWELLRRLRESPVDVVFDLGFAALMTPREITSVGQQLMYCYASNRRSAAPARLHLSDFSLEDNACATAVSNVAGFSDWKGVQLHAGALAELGAGANADWLAFSPVSDKIQELLEKQRGGEEVAGGPVPDPEQLPPPPQIQALTTSEMVYLTSDAEETLESFEAGTVYVIGGIVDRNRHKKLCYDKAVSLGMRTAKLPIGDKVTRHLNYNKPLAINHVFDIMLKFLETKDWEKALLEGIPGRMEPQAAAADDKAGDLEKAAKAEESNAGEVENPSASEAKESEAKESEAKESEARQEDAASAEASATGD